MKRLRLFLAIVFAASLATLAGCQRAQQTAGTVEPQFGGGPQGATSGKRLDQSPKGIDDVLNKGDQGESQIINQKRPEEPNTINGEGKPGNDGDNVIENLINDNTKNNTITPPSSDINRSANQTPPTTGGSGSGVCKNGTVSAADVDRYASQAASAMQPHEMIVYIDPSILNPAKQVEANLARVGFIKALAHTSFNPVIEGFTDVSDGNCAVYKVDMQRFWGTNWQRQWQLLSSNTPAADSSFDPARQRFIGASAAEQGKIAQRIISAQRVAYNSTFPSTYYALVGAPASISRIQQGRTLAIGGYANGIPCGPRVLAIRESQNPDGSSALLFTAADPGSPGEPNNRLPAQAPRSGRDMIRIRQISASESMQQLPNGFFRYFIFRNPGSVGTKALQSGVIDPGNPHNSFTLVGGRSCITCHNNGIRGAPVDTANMGNGWSTTQQMEALFTQSRQLYINALTSIVSKVSSGDAAFNEKVAQGRSREPIAFLIFMVEGPSRQTRPYASCRQAAGDKFQGQIRDMSQIWASEMASLSGGSTGAAGGAAQSAGGAAPNGAQAYLISCKTCHPDEISVRGKPIPPDMWEKGGITNDPAAQQAIRAHLGG